MDSHPRHTRKSVQKVKEVNGSGVQRQDQKDDGRKQRLSLYRLRLSLVCMAALGIRLGQRCSGQTPMGMVLEELCHAGQQSLKDTVDDLPPKHGFVNSAKNDDVWQFGVLHAHTDPNIIQMLKNMEPTVSTGVFMCFQVFTLEVILAFGGSRLNASERNISPPGLFCESVSSGSWKALVDVFL